MSFARPEMKIFTGSANPELARRIASSVGVPLGDATVRPFADGETCVRINEDIRGRDVFIVQPTCPPTNHHLMELLIVADAVRRASAARITAVMPFFGYGRQDRKDQPRVPITAKLVANLITAAGIDRVLTVDLHAQQIQGFFDIPLDHLYALPVFVKHLQTIVDPESWVMVSPDVGGFKTAATYAHALRIGLATVFKTRKSDTEVDHVLDIIGDVQGKHVLIADDLTTTAGTITSAAKMCKDQGALTVTAAVTHAVLTQMGIERIAKSEVSELITTNSVPNSFTTGNFGACKVTHLCIAPLLGEAIKRIHSDESVSSLFEINGK